MRKNLFELSEDFRDASRVLDEAVQARISGDFRKVWKQDEREFSALKKCEEIAASIAETVNYCLVLQKSLRANRVDLAQRSDHLSTDFMERERRNLERAAELQSLIQPESQAVADVIELRAAGEEVA